MWDFVGKWRKPHDRSFLLWLFLEEEREDIDREESKDVPCKLILFGGSLGNCILKSQNSD